MIALSFIVILLCWLAKGDEIAEHFYVLASGVFGSSFAALWVFIYEYRKTEQGLSVSYFRKLHPFLNMKPCCFYIELIFMIHRLKRI